MFEVEKIVKSLQAKGVSFQAADERLACNAPKGVINEDIARTIKENKQVIIEYLLQNKELDRRVDHIERVEGKTSAPLTLSEERLMFMEKLVYGISSFNLPVPIKLIGEVDTDVFERCLQEIVDRHDILRSTFIIEEDAPVRIIHPSLKVNLEIVDCTPTGNQADLDYIAFMMEAGKKSFDLSVAPLFKFMLFKIKENESIFFFVKPSIVWDGWSFDIFLNELDLLYDAFFNGKPSPLPELEIQYSDYAIWHHKRMHGPEISKQIDYWRAKLPKRLPKMNLPYDFKRTASFSYKGRRKAFKISTEKVSQLARICSEENATLFLGFLTIFKILLFRYCNQNNIFIGLPMWNRVRPEMENVIGHFVNNVLFLNDVLPDLNFKQLLGRIKNNFIEAFNNQEAPFEKIAEDLEIDQEEGGGPIYQVFFSYQDARTRPHKIGNLAIEQIYVLNSMALTDLSFWLKESDIDMAGGIDYSVDLFAPETIDQIYGHYLALVDSIVENPAARISELPMLTEKEINQLLTSNRTETEFVPDKCIGSLFKEAAVRHADNIAVEFDGKELTYRELDVLSDDFANLLNSKLSGSKSSVGLLMDPSIGMVVAMLGILKSGNHYIPMEPSLPVDRLRYYLNDSDMSLIVTCKRHKTFCEEASVEFICADLEWNPGDESTFEIEAGLANETACLIYCPSPEGDPVAVEVSQTSLLNLISHMHDAIGIVESDVLLAMSDLTHGVSTVEILLPLLAGSKIVLADKGVPNDIESLKVELDRSVPTVMHAPASTWRKLIDAGWEGSKKIRILSGREKLSQDLAGELMPRCRELWNMFGTVETTFWSAAQKISTPEQAALIGRPVANTSIYVLDDQLQQMPEGAAGNLYIGGLGITKGYWKRPESTRDKFRPDTVAKISGSNMYRTGDIAKYRRDGGIELLNRADGQVKLNGNRIETSEIERRLELHASVAKALVIPYKNGYIPKELIGYFTPRNGAAVTIDDLYDHLKQMLPAYMIPQHLVELKDFPLDSAGKVDRKRLPGLLSGKAEVKKEYVAPRNEVEERLVEIWENILAKSPIGVQSNFFELGGHSFMAARMFALIEKEFDKKIPLALLFQSPTIEALAAKLSQKDWKPNWSSLVPIQSDGTKTPLFIVHGAEGNVLIYREVAKYLGNDQPVYGLQSQGLNGETDIPTTIEDMAGYYINEIRAVLPDGPFRLGGYCLGGHIALEMAVQLLSQGYKVDLLALFESYNFKDGITLPGYYRTIHKLQNLGYHLENFLAINSKDKIKFFSRKFKTEYERFVTRVRRAITDKKKILGPKSDSNHRQLPVVDINHRAQLNYDPNIYNGRITLFRPRKFFAGRNDRFFGWGEIARDGVDVRTLPYGPHIMFVEPFVRKLASELKNCLEQPS